MRGLSSCIRRNWLSLMLAAALGGLALDALLGPSGPRDLLILRRHSRLLMAQRDALLIDNATFREKIRRLRSDDTYLEQLIRKELGYVRPGELVYRFPTSEQP
jgi:cell division protein FtsB